MYDRLQKVGVTVSHRVTVRWLARLGETYDAEVIDWKNQIASNLGVLDEVEDVNFFRVSVSEYLHMFNPIDPSHF